MKKKIKMKKSTKLSLLFIAFVIVLTLVSVLKDESASELIARIKTANPRYLILAVLCVLGFLLMQGVIIYMMCRSLNLKESLWHCMLMSFHGYFFCNITPMQTGGPIIQIYDLRKEGVSVPAACMLIFNMTFLFKLVLFVLSIGFLTVGQGMLAEYTGSIHPLVNIGFFLTIAVTLLLGLLIFNTKLTKKLAIRVFDWSVRRHLQKKNIEKRRAKMLDMFDQYKDVAGFFMTHLKLMGILLLLTFVQRFLYFSSTWFVYKSFGLSGSGWLTICLLQSLINIIADLLPVPGDVGVGEIVFNAVFAKIFGSYLSSGLLLSRGITYYAQLVICGIMTVVASLTFRFDRSKLGRTKKVYYYPPDKYVQDDDMDDDEEDNGNSSHRTGHGLMARLADDTGFSDAALEEEYGSESGASGEEAAEEDTEDADKYDDGFSDGEADDEHPEQI